MEGLTTKESALIQLCIENYLVKLEGSADKTFVESQIKIAQSVFEKVLGLKLSDDGRTISGL